MTRAMSSPGPHSDGPKRPGPASVHLPSLVVALVIMLGATVYPGVFSRANGTPDQVFAFAGFWAMSAGLVRGVGFVPRALAWRLVFSGWSCGAALSLAICWHWGF